MVDSSFPTAAAAQRIPVTAPARAAPPVHDVLIVGGGLVGASLAIALERLDLDVGLIEAAPPGVAAAAAAGEVSAGTAVAGDAAREGSNSEAPTSEAPTNVFDQRNLSFAEATVNALTALGVLQKLRAPSGSIRRIHISRIGDFGRTVLEPRKHGREEFGRVVVARDFGDALEARLAELPRLTRYRAARFIGLADDDGSHRAVRVADVHGERVLRARLLVGADGTRSGVRDALGIGADQHDYGQTLFVCRLRCARAPDGTAYERLGDDGPTALLPRGDRHYGLIHAVAARDADAVAALDEAGFLARVQEAFGWRAGRFLDCGPRSRYPATRVLAQRTTAARAVLVGNAAQTIHPVGAQGFNLGLRDALTLAELIEVARGTDALADCGQPAMLDEYIRRRRDDRDRTLAFSDQLVRLSSNPARLLRPLRSAGLFAFDRLASVQSWLVGGAMGYRGDVPALCRAPAPGGAQP